MTTQKFLYRPSERVSNCVDKLTIAFLKLGIVKPVDENAVRNKLQIEILRAIVDIQTDTFANSTITPVENNSRILSQEQLDMIQKKKCDGQLNIVGVCPNISSITPEHLQYILKSESYAEYHINFRHQKDLHYSVIVNVNDFHRIRMNSKVNYS